MADPFDFLFEGEGAASGDPFDFLFEEHEPDKLPYWKEVGRAFGSSAMNLGTDLFRFNRAITPSHVAFNRLFPAYDAAVDESVADFQARAAALAPPDQRPFLERLDDKPFRTLSRTAAEALPSIAPALLGGMPGAFTTGFASSSLQSYDEAIARGNDERTALAIAAGVGTLSALLEGYGAKGLLEPLKSVFGRGLAQRVARGETDRLVRQVLTGSLKEGGTEMAQELAAAAGELLGENPRPLADVVAELDDRLAQAGTGGVLLGGGVGGVAMAGQARSNTRARRTAAKELLERARASDPSVLAHYVRPRQTGEWAMEALPTGSWEVDGLREAHEALGEVATPDVLDAPEWGERRVRRGIQRSAAWLGAERPFVEIVRQGFGDKVADQLQNTLSYARKATTLNRTIQDGRLVNHANQEIGPAYKEILSLVAAIPEHQLEDSSNGQWLTQFAGVRDRKGNPKMKNGRRVLPDHIRKNPGMRYFEEARWGLRMLDLRRRKAILARRLKQLESKLASEGVFFENGTELEPMSAEWKARRDQSLDLQFADDVMGAGVLIDPETGFETEESLRRRPRGRQKAKGRPTFASEAPETADVDALKRDFLETQREFSAIQFSKKIMADVEQRVGWLKKHRQWKLIKNAAEAASAWDQAMITMMADAQIISRDQEQRILAHGKHYAGFYVSTPEAMPSVVRERLTKGAEEPGQVKVGLRKNVPLMLPSEASLFRMATVARDAHRQIGKNNLLDLVEAAPEFWKAAGVSLKPIKGVHRPDLFVRAMRNGKQVPVYMPKELLQAFENLTPVEADINIRLIKSYFRAIANQRRVTALLTPTFAVGQVFRDQTEAAIFAAEVGYRPYVEAARGVLHMLTGSAEAKAFRAFGGGMGSIASLDIGRSEDMLADVALRAREEDITSTMRLVMARLNRFRKTWWGQEVAQADAEHVYSGIFYPMARLLETLDTSTRLGAYLRALDKGYTEAEAMAVSRRSAIDFALHGSTTAAGSQYLPFMGARAQAFALNREAVKRAGRAGKEAGKGKGWMISQAVALRAGAAALMPLWYMVVVPELVHWWLHKDDEDYHLTKEDWEKKKYYHWYQFDNGEWAKSPRPLGYLSRIFGYALGQALDEAYADRPRTAENVLAALQDEIPGAAEFPLGFGAHQPLVLSDAALDFGVKTGGVPPGLEPFQIAMTDRTAWQHRLVVPEWQGKRLPPRQHGFRTTHPVYVDIARLIPGNAEEVAQAVTEPVETASRVANFATGGRVGSAERFPTTAPTSTKTTSPLWLEQYGRFLVGSVGSELSRFEKAVEGVMEGEEVPLSELPVIRNFAARAKDAPQMWPVRRLFELAEEAQIYRNMTKARAEGLTATERKTYERLLERREKGEPLSPSDESRLRQLEIKGLTPDQDDILTMATYEELYDRIAEVRELISAYHDYRQMGDTAKMEEIDQMIIDLSLQALARFSDQTGKEELGATGKGWAAKWFEQLGVTP